MKCIGNITILLVICLSSYSQKVLGLNILYKSTEYNPNKWLRPFVNTSPETYLELPWAWESEVQFWNDPIQTKMKGSLIAALSGLKCAIEWVCNFLFTSKNKCVGYLQIRAWWVISTNMYFSIASSIQGTFVNCKNMTIYCLQNHTAFPFTKCTS